MIREGELYRLVDPKKNGGPSAFYYADGDAKRIVFTFICSPNADSASESYKLKISRADPGANYVDKLTGKKYSGAELRAGIVIETGTEKFVDRRYFVKL